MNCPLCANPDSRVIDTRGERRRRQCAHCRHRWTTVEVVESRALATERVAKAILAAAGELAEER